MDLRTALLGPRGSRLMARMGTRTGWKRAPEQRARTGPIAATSAYAIGGDGGAQRRMRDYASYLNAITIPNVYKAVSVIASNFASVPVLVLDDNEDDVDIKADLPDLHALITKPNPLMKGRTFKQFLALDYQLTGNAIVALDNPNGLDRPTEMYRLNPANVVIVQQGVGQTLYGYEVEVDRAKKFVWFDGETEILHVKWADPRSKDHLWGLGPVEAGATELDADRRVAEFTYNYFDRGAILTGILQTDQTIPEDDRRAMVNDFRALMQGERNRFKTAMLWQGAKYTPTQDSMSSIPIVNLKEMGRDSVLELFGVPPQMLGDYGDSNYRNAQEASAFFWSETEGPMLDQFEEDFWTPLIELFAENWTVKYERPEILDLDMRTAAAQKMAATGAATVNMVRTLGGFDPLPDEDELGEYIVLPKNTTLISPDAARGLGLIDAPTDTATTETVAEPDEMPDSQPDADADDQAAAAANGADADGAQGQAPAATAGNAPAAQAGASGGKSAQVGAARQRKTEYPPSLLSRGYKDRLARDERRASRARAAERAQRHMTERERARRERLRLMPGGKTTAAGHPPVLDVTDSEMRRIVGGDDDG